MQDGALQICAHPRAIAGQPTRTRPPPLMQCESMHGKEKTKTVAQSLRGAIDWVERVVQEVRMRAAAGACAEFERYSSPAQNKQAGWKQGGGDLAAGGTKCWSSCLAAQHAWCGSLGSCHA